MVITTSPRRPCHPTASIVARWSRPPSFANHLIEIRHQRDRLQFNKVLLHTNLELLGERCQLTVRGRSHWQARFRETRQLGHTDM